MAAKPQKKELSIQLHRGLVWAMVLILVGSLAMWYATRDVPPPVIRIATAAEGGLYHQFGRLLAEKLRERTGHRVRVIVSQGSQENRRMLLGGEADLVILQGGSVPADQLAAVAPLYREVVHVIARKDRGIQSLIDLDEKAVVLGLQGSGMRRSALNVLRQYELDDAIDDRFPVYFKDLLVDDSLDAAIVTTGVLNSDLRQLLATDGFDLIPIADARALEIQSPFWRQYTIPRGLFGERPPLPGSDVMSVASVCFLACRPDASNRLIRETLGSVYEEGMSLQIPTMLTRREALQWVPMRLHRIAQDYFNPEDKLGRTAAIMESLAAGKELLFALGAATYLLWDRLRRLRRDENKATLQAQKDRLDAFLARTLSIEQAQMETRDPERLQAYLDAVTRIKLEALQEFTDEELRADQSFSIFLLQCANLINKIQIKLLYYGTKSNQSEAETDAQQQPAET